MSHNTPNIRFRDFHGEWEEKTLGEIAEFSNERISTSSLSCSNYVTTENMLSDFQGVGQATSVPKNTNVIRYRKNDILLSNIRPYLKKVWQADKDGGCSADVFVIEALNSCSPDFLHYIIGSDSFINHCMIGAKGVKMPRGDKEQMKTFVLGIPSLPEQLMIGEFFSSLDRLIGAECERLVKLRQVKAACLQNMFPQPGHNTPQLRFKGFQGEWERVKLGEMSKKIIDKNTSHSCNVVFTNSAEHGIIDQRDFFDSKIAKSENINGYYVVQPNDYVYNPRISTLAPVGPINRNRLSYAGVISPLYYVFRVAEDIADYNYLDYFFKTSLWHSFMFQNGNSGARADRFSIGDDTFKEMPIILPKHKAEQRKIGDYFSVLDRRIALQSERVLKLRQVKSACLDGMFV